jgi:hypothetical protein
MRLCFRQRMFNPVPFESPLHVFYQSTPSFIMGPVLSILLPALALQWHTPLTLYTFLFIYLTIQLWLHRL